MEGEAARFLAAAFSGRRAAEKFILSGMRPWRSWIARVTPTHKAAGSNPVGRTRNPHKRIVYAGFSCLKVAIKILGLTTIAAVNPVFSDFETLLECFAGRFLILIEGVGVNVQRGGGLGVAQEACHRSYVRAVSDQKAGVAVAKGVDVQPFRQVVLFENQLEPPGEGAGGHGIAAAVLAEYEVILCQLTVFAGIRLEEHRLLIESLFSLL